MKNINVHDAKRILEKYREMKMMKNEALRITYLVCRSTNNVDQQVLLLKEKSKDHVLGRFLDIAYVHIYSVEIDDTTEKGEILEAKEDTTSMVLKTKKQTQLSMAKFVVKKQISLAGMEEEVGKMVKKKDTQLSMKKFVYKKVRPVTETWLKKIEKLFQRIESTDKLADASNLNNVLVKEENGWMDDEEGDSMVRNAEMSTEKNTFNDKLSNAEQENTKECTNMNVNWFKNLDKNTELMDVEKGNLVDIGHSEAEIEKVAFDDVTRGQKLMQKTFSMNNDINIKVDKNSFDFKSAKVGEHDDEFELMDDDEADLMIRDVEIDTQDHGADSKAFDKTEDPEVEFNNDTVDDYTRYEKLGDYSSDEFTWMNDEETDSFIRDVEIDNAEHPKAENDYRKDKGSVQVDFQTIESTDKLADANNLNNELVKNENGWMDDEEGDSMVRNAEISTEKNTFNDKHSNAEQENTKECSNIEHSEAELENMAFDDVSRNQKLMWHPKAESDYRKDKGSVQVDTDPMDGNPLVR